MKEALQRIRLVLVGLVLVGAGTAYMAISQQQGGGGWGGGTTCLLIFLILTTLFLVVYVTCAITCGDSDEPLDPVCVRRCWRTFVIIEGILIVLLFLCLAGTHIF